MHHIDILCSGGITDQCIIGQSVVEWKYNHCDFIPEFVNKENLWMPCFIQDSGRSSDSSSVSHSRTSLESGYRLLESPHHHHHSSNSHHHHHTHRHTASNPAGKYWFVYYLCWSVLLLLNVVALNTEMYVQWNLSVLAICHSIHMWQVANLYYESCPSFWLTLIIYCTVVLCYFCHHVMLFKYLQYFVWPCDLWVDYILNIILMWERYFHLWFLIYRSRKKSMKVLTRDRWVERFSDWLTGTKIISIVSLWPT